MRACQIMDQNKSFAVDSGSISKESQTTNVISDMMCMYVRSSTYKYKNGWRLNFPVDSYTLVILDLTRLIHFTHRHAYHRDSKKNVISWEWNVDCVPVKITYGQGSSGSFTIVKMGENDAFQWLQKGGQIFSHKMVTAICVLVPYFWKKYNNTCFHL